MGALSAGDLTNLRTNHPHIKRTWLSPVLHVQILKARVNNPGATLGDMSIPYDGGTGTAAEYALVGEGQTFLLGTSAGDDDLGRGRVISITGNQVTGTLTVSWNSDVAWADNMYLTVLHLYELWPKFPRFTISPEVFYKDYDDTYSDQNEDRRPVPIMGPGWAGFLSTVTGLVSTNLVATNSYAMATGASISTYAWTVTTAVAGAAPSIAAAAAASTTIEFDTAGLYWVKLVVTDDNGKSTWTVRPFIVHDTTELPYYPEEVRRTEDWESGGTSLTFIVHLDADEDLIPDRTPLILWSENVYNESAADVARLDTDEYTGRTHVDFFGYLTKADTSAINPQGTGEVSFEAHTIHHILDQRFEYPVPLIADRKVTGAVDEWWKFPNTELTVANALQHLWLWHSTLHWISDVYYPTGNTLIRAGCEELTEGSLMDRARTFALEHGIFAKPVANPYGTLYVEVDVQMLDTADRAAVTDLFTLADTDWRGRLAVIENHQPPTAMAYLSGGKWDGSRFTPLLSKWGQVAGNVGERVAVADRIMAASQSDINMLCGRVVALENNEIREVRVDLAGNWSSAVGVAPQEWVRMTLSGTEDGNKRGVVLSNARMKIMSVETTFNEPMGLSKTRLIMVPEAIGRDGITGDYPDGGDDGEYGDYPDPPAPVWPLPVTEYQANSLLAFDNTNGCYWLAEGAADWVERNDALAGTDIQDTQGGYDPWWRTAEKQNSTNPEDAITLKCDVGAIFRSTDNGKTWVDVTPVDDPPDTYTQTPAPTATTVTYVQRTDNIHINGWHVFSVEYYDGASWGSWLLFTEDDCLTWTWRSALGLIADGGGYLYPVDAGAYLGARMRDGQVRSMYLSSGNAGNMTGEADGIEVCYKYNTGDNGAAQVRLHLVYNMGTQITGNWSIEMKARELGTLYAKNKGIWATNTESKYQACINNGTFADWDLNVGCDNDYLNVGTTSQWRVVHTEVTGSSYQYFELGCELADSGDFWEYGSEICIDSFRISGTYSVEEYRPLWMDVDSEDGTVLWVTLWKGDDTLVLQKWSTATKALSTEYSLGSCTIAQLNNSTYVAYPYTPTFDKDTCYVFGRMNNPQALGNPSHLIRTINGGGAWTLLDGTLGADHIGAFRAEGETTSLRTFFGIVNSFAGGAAPKLYGGAETFAYISDLTFAAGTWVYVDAMAVNVPKGTVACGGDTGAALMIIEASSPYTTWNDTTLSYPITGGVSSLLYV